ncbi:MAG: O-antigen ligase family protein [Peptococcaceae bacterium]|jgi:O-antigen ligase/tetratricopeptide (TPR) repeat protein|nr:O-antigen ligase family protein [Peptococcaceae bacterium]MDH7524524.1 O-antigen ligase family protein [Peptococcaceae bacterium]
MFRLKALAYWATGAGLAAAPLLKGLFYPEELVLAQVYLGVAWLLYAISRLSDKRVELKFGSIDCAVLAYLLANVLTLFVAVHLHEAVLGVYRAIDYILIFFLVSSLTREAKEREKFTRFIFFSTVLVSVIGILAAMEMVSFPEAYAGKRIMSTFQYPNALAIYSAVGIITGLGFLMTSSAAYAKILVGTGIYLDFIALLGSLSRGTWLVLGLVFLVYLLGSGKRFFWPSLYQIMVITLIGCISSKGFLGGVYRQNYTNALEWLVLGGAFIAAGLAAIHVLPAVARRKRFLRRHKKVLLWAFTLEILCCILFYFSYASQVLPTPASQLLDTEVIQRFGTIGGEDGSYMDRMDYNRVALQIVGDHPVLGTGAGGWNALYHLYQDRLYWSSEVHNHYFQTWVESGTVGLAAYLAVWLSLLWRIIRFLLRPKGDSRWPYTWAVLLAFLALLVHSGIDMELSMPAVALVFWSLAAVVKSEVNGHGRRRRKTLAVPKPGYIAGCLLVGVILIILPVREYRAILLGKAGAEEKRLGYYPRAIDKFEQAYRLSPLSPDLAAALAELYARRYKSLPLDVYKQRVYYYANRAVELAPYNIKTRWSLDAAYGLVGDEEALLKERERLAGLLPKDPYTLGTLAKTYFEQGMAFLERGNSAGARLYFSRCVSLTPKIEENYLMSEKRPNMRPSAQVYLLSGQASLLLADKEAAVEALSKALHHKDTKNQAGSLLALAYEDVDPANCAKFYNQYVKNNQENRPFFEKNRSLLNLVNGGKT